MVIRFKSFSRVDEFTLLWNTCYRLTNIFFMFFSMSLLEAVQVKCLHACFTRLLSSLTYEDSQCFRDDPDRFITTLSAGIMRQSKLRHWMPFFFTAIHSKVLRIAGTILMNMMILATGIETMLQLLQWRSIIKNMLCRPFCHLNSKSSRFISWLNECPYKEQGFLFGYFAPVLSYGLIIALIYSFTGA